MFSLLPDANASLARKKRTLESFRVFKKVKGFKCWQVTEAKGKSKMCVADTWSFDYLRIASGISDGTNKKTHLQSRLLLLNDRLLNISSNDDRGGVEEISTSFMKIGTFLVPLTSDLRNAKHAKKKKCKAPSLSAKAYIGVINTKPFSFNGALSKHGYILQ